MSKKPIVQTEEQKEEIRTKDFFDMILPGTVKFMTDHYILGDSYRCVWAVREYPPSTEEQAILSQLADRSGVTVRIYHRLVESIEQRKIIQNATRRNKLKIGSNDMNENIEAEGNLQDVIELLANLRKNREPLLHCSVFIELKAKSMDALRELQSEIAMELTRSKILVDRLTLRQKEGFLSVLPVGANQFGAQYERVLPASSAANLYPFNFSGKTDPHGIYIGRDKFGSNVLVDFDRRSEDKTTSNTLILGNSGQGKSYLLKLILTNIRESGKSIICLDPESEYEEICSALGGCYIDFMSGEYTVNPLEPKAWTDGTDAADPDAPAAFKKVTRLSQHIAFLKDFFRAYKDFSDSQIDTIEILLTKLYARFGITDTTDYSRLKPTDYPIMEDFYKLCEEEFYGYDKKGLELGFTSVMYDGSVLSTEENTANTIIAVESAKTTGASVEAEIGSMGAREGGEGSAASIYTDPAAAVKFVADTGIDALACAFGTAHGFYKDKPKLDFERLSKIHSLIDIPIVMHGGSGVSEEDYREVIKRGVRKVNYYTYMAKAGGDAISNKTYSQFHDALLDAEKAMRDNAKKAISVFSGL